MMHGCINAILRNCTKRDQQLFTILILAQICVLQCIIVLCIIIAIIYTMSRYSAEHAMSTPLEDVGLQVWRGALLMADYLVHNPVRFQDSVVLELGAGTGLVSIVAALTAQTVFCTGMRYTLSCCGCKPIVIYIYKII